LKEDANPRWKTIRRILDYLGYEIRLVKRKKRGGELNVPKNP
jgi:hypothetical protein